MYLACGTSGAVQPAAGLVHATRRLGGHSVLVNLETLENTNYFARIAVGRSGAILPALLGIVGPRKLAEP